MIELLSTPKSIISHLLLDQVEFKYKKARLAKERLTVEIGILTAKVKRAFLPIPRPKLENGQINLHLGCGSINHPKFINIDGLPASHIHYIRPVDDLFCLKQNSVDLIYSSHCLEHFPHGKVPSVLAEWFRVLKKDKILRISVPNFDVLVKIYQENGNDINSIVSMPMGAQDYKYNFHMTVFNEASLRTLLSEVGFRVIEEWKPGSCELTTFNDYSAFRFEINGKKYPISLNLQAIK